MPVFRAIRRIHHRAEEMFDLVADVERYPEFVPLCLKHAIRSRARRAGTEIFMTDMTVSCGICRESFISRVTLDRANGCILVESTDGPLRRLQTRWTFQSRSDDNCDVGFYLQYELASWTLALLMGAHVRRRIRPLRRGLRAPCRRCLRSPARRMSFGAISPRSAARTATKRLAIVFLISKRPCFDPSGSAT